MRHVKVFWRQPFPYCLHSCSTIRRMFDCAHFSVGRKSLTRIKCVYSEFFLDKSSHSVYGKRQTAYSKAYFKGKF